MDVQHSSYIIYGQAFFVLVNQLHFPSSHSIHFISVDSKLNNQVQLKMMQETLYETIMSPNDKNEKDEQLRPKLYVHLDVLLFLSPD